MSSNYQARYARKKRWIPYEEYVARKQTRRRRAATTAVVPRYRVSGRGAYTFRTTDKQGRAKKPWYQRVWKYAPEAGGMLGNFIAPGIGGQIGSTAGSLLAQIAGHGAYAVKRNTIMFPDQVPIFGTKEDGCIRMRHREFITDIISDATPGNFLSQRFPIDVADPTTFPFFAQIASNFEEWHMNGLIFEFKTTSGSLSTTGQLGTVCLATQYNSNSLPFSNKQSMEAYTFASSTVPSASVIHPVECDPASTPSNGMFYTNVPGTGSGTEDKRWQQLGVFTIATVGMPNASENVGELWVSYDCTLCKPRLISNTGALADNWVLGAGIAVGGGAGPYFGTAPALTVQSDDFTALGGNIIYFNDSFNGRVAITYFVRGAAGLWVDPLFSAGVGATAVNMLTNGSNQYTSSYLATDTGLDCTSYWDIVSSPGAGPGYGAQITLSGGAFFTPTDGNLIITQIPSDFQ